MWVIVRWIEIGWLFVYAGAVNDFLDLLELSRYFAVVKEILDFRVSRLLLNYDVLLNMKRTYSWLAFLPHWPNLLLSIPSIQKPNHSLSNLNPTISQLSQKFPFHLNPPNQPIKSTQTNPKYQRIPNVNYNPKSSITSTCCYRYKRNYPSMTTNQTIAKQIAYYLSD